MSDKLCLNCGKEMFGPYWSGQHFTYHCESCEVEFSKDYHEQERERQRVDLLLAAILLGRFNPLAPHHVGAIRERLGYATDEEVLDFVRTGKREEGEKDG